ncbi:MAG: thiamine biosynthesis protein ThiF [Acutalibacteraceae bacterium]
MKITLNGKYLNTSSQSLEELKNEVNKRTCVTIVNGFQTNENHKLKENDSIFLIEKGVMPDEEELKAMLMARHTPGVHKKIEKARVAVLGLGGLGSNIALQLARTGVGCLHLIDFDVVEPSNLNRQQYKIKHLGMYKTDALKQEISEINPYIKVITNCIKLDENNILDIIKGDEIICEAFDNPDCKAMAVNAVLENYPEKYIVAASGMAGFESGNTIKTKKITSRFYMCGDGETGAQQGRGLMAPRVSICAGHQANTVLRILTGEYGV